MMSEMEIEPKEITTELAERHVIDKKKKQERNGVNPIFSRVHKAIEHEGKEEIQNKKSAGHFGFDHGCCYFSRQDAAHEEEISDTGFYLDTTCTITPL
jgi:uncharacterized circularly permuted ATP-grasp superfamily protein